MESNVLNQTAAQAAPLVTSSAYEEVYDRKKDKLERLLEYPPDQALRANKLYVWIGMINLICVAVWTGCNPAAGFADYYSGSSASVQKY